MKTTFWLLLVSFILLSFADYGLTRWLLYSNPDCYEANPIAAGCLDHTGWAGLAVLKALSVSIVLACACWLKQLDEACACGVLGFACALVGGVVVSGACLL